MGMLTDVSISASQLDVYMDSAFGTAYFIAKLGILLIVIAVVIFFGIGAAMHRYEVNLLKVRHGTLVHKRCVGRYRTNKEGEKEFVMLDGLKQTPLTNIPFKAVQTSLNKVCFGLMPSKGIINILHYSQDGFRVLEPGDVIDDKVVTQFKPMEAQTNRAVQQVRRAANKYKPGGSFLREHGGTVALFSGIVILALLLIFLGGQIRDTTQTLKASVDSNTAYQQELIDSYKGMYGECKVGNIGIKASDIPPSPEPIPPG